MKTTTRIIAAAALIAASPFAFAQARGLKRSDLSQHDMSIPGGQAAPGPCQMIDASLFNPTNS